MCSRPIFVTLENINKDLLYFISWRRFSREGQSSPVSIQDFCKRRLFEVLSWSPTSVTLRWLFTKLPTPALKSSEWNFVLNRVISSGSVVVVGVNASCIFQQLWMLLSLAWRNRAEHPGVKKTLRGADLFSPLSHGKWKDLSVRTKTQGATHPVGAEAWTELCLCALWLAIMTHL